MREKQNIFQSGRFFVGCNYWASHAGTEMWKNWDETSIEKDLERLSKHNIRVLRVFPLWRDFQPLRIHYGGPGILREIRMNEQPLPFTEEGRAGLDPVMIDRFRIFCDIAERNHIKLIVGLITGWMSGRLFAPEAFLGRNLISDPLVVRWQIRFVRYIVKHFKNHPAIAAWDLGNECNCMEYVDKETAFTWTCQITNAIRTEDRECPVVSGMHGLTPEGVWTPMDQGEALDILCTHPYPLYTPFCDTDPINEMKSPLHATAESLMYSDLSGKPCFIEEAGTLGPMIADEKVTQAYIRSALFSAWAHDLRGFVWWCANEQTHLTHTPYDWIAVERELGLFYLDGSPKPVADAMKQFADFVDSFEFGSLPPRLTDAVCVLSHQQDQWATAYGSFILAKQSGLDISFCWCDDEIPESNVYLLPALTGASSVFRNQLQALTERVRNGATLYISLNDAIISSFSELTGIKVVTRSCRSAPDTVLLGNTQFSLNSPIKHVFQAIDAKELAVTADGDIAMSEYTLGKGRVIFCAYPIELDVATKPGVVSGKYAIPYYKFYDVMNIRNGKKVASVASHEIGLTEHILDEQHRLLLILNHTPRPITELVHLNNARYVRQIQFCGGVVQEVEEGLKINIPENTGMIVLLETQTTN